MRWFWSVVLLCAVLAGCTRTEDACPKLWKLDRADIASYATLDSMRLRMEVFNPASPNALVLEQQGLIGDFDVSVRIDSFAYEAGQMPQFRLEVFSMAAPTLVSGVALNATAVYTYIGSSENRDIRLIGEHTGTVRVSRSHDMLTCSAVLGQVSLHFSDTLNRSELGVRLVLGSTASGQGHILTVLDDFMVTRSANEVGRVSSDTFDCMSW